MNSTERVRRTILGQPVDRQPIYGWIYGNLTWEIDQKYGSLAGFEKQFEFDAAHVFTGPDPFRGDVINEIRESNEEMTPDLLVEAPIFSDPDDMASYRPVTDTLNYYKREGERFCYIQTPGLLEQFNGLFGIQNSLTYLALYPDEMDELYRRQTEWTRKYALHCLDLGVDMIHISDDWGAQKDLLISPRMWKQMIFPKFKQVADDVHNHGGLISLHSDGCITRVLDGVRDIGFDLVHPWQENANMPYDIYLNNYTDDFAIMGGINVQNALGILPRDQLEYEIRRVFGLLKGKRWVVCTTHFVQKHCSVDDLDFAYRLIYSLARES